MALVQHAFYKSSGNDGACDLPTCHPEVARPVHTRAFVGTNPTGEPITSGSAVYWHWLNSMGQSNPIHQ
jgi:hypothetical protein